MNPLVSLDRQGTTAVLRLQRPPANALNDAVFSQILDVLPQLTQAGGEVRALVLIGQGRFFSAGLDLFEVFGYPDDRALAFARLFDDVMTQLLSLQIPVVAALNGHAMAGGAVLAALADFRIAAAGQGQLGLPEILVGVPFPTTAFEAVRCAFSGPHFSQLVYRGRAFLPAEALAAHLVDEVVPPEELLPRALSLCAELSSRPRIAFASTKRALRQDALQRVADAKAAGGGLDPIWQHWRTPEVLQAMFAYRDAIAGAAKKPPAP